MLRETGPADGPASWIPGATNLDAHAMSAPPRSRSPPRPKGFTPALPSLAEEGDKSQKLGEPAHALSPGMSLAGAQRVARAAAGGGSPGSPDQSSGRYRGSSVTGLAGSIRYMAPEVTSPSPVSRRWKSRDLCDARLRWRWGIITGGPQTFIRSQSSHGRSPTERSPSVRRARG